MDIKDIKDLVELMVANDLSRIEIQQGETHILLRRGQPIVVSSLAGAPAAAPPANPAPAPSAPVAASPAPVSASDTYIRSPMVGTFYSAPDPDSPAFIKVGDRVEPDTVVCLIEAMKVFNEIKAEVRGTITRVLASNAQAVEYDQPLFAVAAS